MSTPVALVALSLALLVPHVQDAPNGGSQDPQTITVSLADGRPVRVQVLDVKDGKAKLRFFAFDGQMTVTRALADFDPASAFEIERAAAGAKTFDEHFALAKRAAELDLLGGAGEEARAAVKAAEGMPDAQEKQAQVRSWGADFLEAKLRAAVDAGDRATAERCLKILTTRLPDQRTQQQRAELADLVVGLREAAEQKQRVARHAKLSEKQRAEVERKLKPIYEQVAAGDKLVREALSQASKPTSSAQACEQAIEHYRMAWTAAEKLGNEHADDADLQSEIAALGDRLRSSGIDAALYAANLLTVQSDYKGALAWTGKVLAFDPDNAEAKQIMRTIQLSEAAASGDWRWGWRNR